MVGVAVPLVAVALALFVRFVVFAPDLPERNPDTGCPETGPSALTAIMIDATDRIGAISRADVLARLEEYVAASREDEMVIGFEARPVGEEVDEPLLTVCHPGDPEKASEWTQNPRLIRRRLEERFRQPLEALFRDLLGRQEAPTSPLMESVQSVAVSYLGREEYVDIPKRLILVSDLMQHSEYLSFFRQPGVDYDTFARSHGADALSTDLRGTTVDVLFVQRDAHGRLPSTRGLAEFWGRWIEDQGGVVGPVSSVDGMN
ncbi:MAG: hypothetical protein OYL92_02785 [Acidobacteriota bacterium]|nr:hypothetical protein [Acidobacteriota bacterium]MDE3263871.1 hypothetical protein [Acidobacteriota bacterium]